MMRWYNKMYLGKSILGKKMYYQYAIQHTKRLTGTYCLMPAACKDDLIDICGSDLLRVSKQYPKDQLVIGLAGSYREACLLAGEIVLDVLKKTGSTDIRAYLRDSGENI